MLLRPLNMHHSYLSIALILGIPLLNYNSSRFPSGGACIGICSELPPGCGIDSFVSACSLSPGDGVDAAAVVELVVEVVVVFLMGLGAFRFHSFINCVSSTFARAFISVVSITGSSFALTPFCFSTQVLNHVSCSFSVFSSASSSSFVYFVGKSAANSAVRFCRASVMKSRVLQFHFWLLFSVCGNASISW